VAACALRKKQPAGQFFLAEATVTSINYLELLQLWLMPQLQEHNEDFIFKQDGAMPHFRLDICAHLNANFPHRRIGRASDNDSPLLSWPPQ
jgi:hypothetical protein